MAKKDDKIVQGRVVAIASTGSKRQSESNEPGTQSDPAVIEDRPMPQRQLPENKYSKVGIVLGVTKSLGNYEFARADVTVEDYCEPDKKEETLKSVNKIAESYLRGITTNIDKYVAEKKKPKTENLGL